ncbi:hypothetical protein SteCoe_21333 [Stentor coeruleus]|uniref:G8 domain-containing protein n=1 Tax=Stentor coeruleus TaxID=5963 RepID=A0A1R2BQD4_9CILI|nr:hypothetical protein SteCoe_21333 [Stentor coeruleus]
MWLGIIMAILANLVSSLTITGVSTTSGTVNELSLKGSIYGGTALYLSGDFSDVDASSMKVLIGEIECPIIEFRWHESSFECTVPKPTDIFTSDLPLTFSTTVDTFITIDSSVSKVFSYTLEETPIIFYMNPSEASPGDDVAFVGRWRTTDWKNVFEAKLGEKQMTIYREDTETLSNWGPFNITVQVGDNIQGIEEPKFLMKSGQAGFSWIGKTFTPTGQGFYFRTLAKIDSTSSSVASPLGQLPLEINGAGFTSNIDDISVTTDGQTCDVTYVDYNVIKCTTRSGTSSSENYYEGNVGILRNMWNDTTDSLENLIGTTPTYTFIQATPEIRRDEYTKTRSQMIGLFKAPKTGEYTFYIASDDAAKVWLSTDASPANKVKIIEFNSWTLAKQKFYQPTTISSVVELQADSLYYMEIWNYNYGGSGHFDIGVQVPGDGSAPNKMPFIQHIIISPREIVREIQTITITPPSGTPSGKLSFYYGSAKSLVVNFNTDQGIWVCDDIIVALNHLNTTEHFLCEYEWSGSSLLYHIKFDSALTSSRKVLTADWTGLQPVGTIVSTSPTPGTTTLSGTFIVKRKGDATQDVKFGTGYSSFEYQVNKELKNIQNNLIVYGTVNSEICDFLLMLPSEMVADSSEYFELDLTGMTGGGIEDSDTPNDVAYTSEILFANANDQFFPVIPSDFLRLYKENPQTIVKVNDVGVVCKGNCDFTYVTQDSNFPTITSFTYSNPTLTLTGTNFDLVSTEAEDFIVTVGLGPCPVDTVSSTEIVCTLGVGIAGNHQPVVIGVKYGLLLLDPNVVDTIFQALTVDSVTPNLGGNSGGTVLNFVGKGFLNDITNTDYTLQVKIGNSVCSIISVSTTKLSCKTSAYTTSNNQLTVTINGETFSSISLFSYTNSAVVNTITPDHGSTITLTTVTLTGENFPTDKKNILVKMGEYDCLVVSSTAQQVVCHMLGGPPGEYTVEVIVINEDNQGYALMSLGFDPVFSLVFLITDISPSSGSIYGGTILTITGSGFSLEKTFMYAFIGTDKFPCEILEVTSESSLTCRTSEHSNIIDAADDFFLYGRLKSRALCTNPCVYTRSTADSPIVNSISPSEAAAGDSVTLQGVYLDQDIANIELKINGILATITSSGSTSIVFVMPEVKGSTSTLSLYIKGKGTVPVSGSLAVKLVVSSIEPLEISQGGEYVTIHGSGFLSSDTFMFGSVACLEPIITDTQVICWAQASTDANAKGLTVRTFTCSDLTVCGLSHTTGKTFTITSTSGSLNIAGTFPTVTSSNVHVTLDDYQCSVTSINTNTIVCLPNAPPGTYHVSVHIENYGFAVGSITATITLSASISGTVSTSYQGGVTLSLTGTGLHEDTQVLVCNIPCETTQALGNSLTCKLPPLVTTHSQSSFNIQPDGKLITTFVQIGSLTSQMSKAYDNDENTYYMDSSVDIYIGLDAGAGNYLQLTKVRFMGGGAANKNYKDLIGTILQGSNDATAWTDINIFTGVNNYWNSWEVNENQEPGDSFSVYKYRYYRMIKKAHISSYAINELEWYGILYIDSSANDQACSVIVNYEATTVTVSSQVSYQNALTPALVSITPNRGTILGGTTVLFAGTGFGTTSGFVTVTIDDVNCAVSTVTDTLITCVTEPRELYVTASLEIMITGKGLVATKGLVYLYADLWSADTTWGGEVPPRDGESVVIPAGKNIILDMPTGLLELIYIKGTLIVDDIPGITIDAHYIFIHGGTLQIGTEDDPFENEITITMHGNRHSPALPMYGNKVIAIRGGLVDIHGKFKTSWTVLDSTIDPGSSSLTLKSDVTNWNPGDQIVVASTSYFFNETEVKTISSISGRAITVDSPFLFKHYAKTQTYGSADTFEMRAEVGMLTRNIKIRGSEEGISTEHGVHIMFHKQGDDSCIGRIDNLEIFYAGQAYSLGRYPIHFHMIGKVSKSYVKNNAIHDTFNRAVTIHGVHYFRVMNNVAYNIKGHTFFIEDGIESQNRIEGNLGLCTKQSWSLLNTDQAPATFWVTNPNNFIRFNHAAGGTNYGYWYANDPHPTGPSATTTICPRYMEIGSFEDNVAHTYGKYGLRIFPRLMPLIDPCSELISEGNFVTTTFYRLTAWKNRRNGAIAEEVGDIRFSGFKVADNMLAGLEMTYTNYATWYQSSRITDAVVVGNSENAELDLNPSQRGIVTPQTDGFLVENTRFYNFGPEQYIFGDESHSVQCPVFDSGGRLVKLSGIKIDGSNKRFHWNWPLRGIYEIIDDQSIWPKGTHIAAPWIHLSTPECSKDDDMGAYICNTATIRRVTIYSIVPSYMLGPSLNVLRQTGTGIPTTVLTAEDGTTETVPAWSPVFYGKGQNNHRIGKSYALPLVTQNNYWLFWGNEAPMDFESLKIEQDIMEHDDWFILHFNFSVNFTDFIVTRGSPPESGDLTDLTVTNVCQNAGRELTSSDPSCTYTFDNITKVFDIIINGVPLNSNQKGDISITKVKPSPPDPGTVDPGDGPKTTLLWSDPSTWADSSVPTDGSLVIVKSSWNLILDVDTPNLQYIEVNGILEFDPTKSVSLKSKWIFVRAGSIISGTAEAPTPSDIKHTILLNGVPNDLKFYYSRDVDQFNKVMIVAGKVDLHGDPRVSYSYLEQNAYPDDTIIFVDTVDWEIGDDILISPSGFAPYEDEVFKITNLVQSSSIIDGFLNDADWIKANNYRNLGKGKTTSINYLVTPDVKHTGLTKITLDKPLKYYHSGVSVIADGKTIEMRTDVSLLTRNVKIIALENGWGGEIIVNDYLDEMTDNGPILRGGSLHLDNVQVVNFGQPDYRSAGIRFINAVTGNSTINNCAFARFNSWGIHAETAHNLIFTSNVMYLTQHRAFIAEYLYNSVISDNLFVRIYKDPLMKSFEKIESVGLMVCFDQVCDYSMTNNKVIGCDEAGILYGVDSCDKSSFSASGNYVRSAEYGTWLVTVDSYCGKADGVIGVFTQHAVMCIGTMSKMTISGITTAESVHATDATLRYEEVYGPGYLGILNSVFLGKTMHSICANCSDPECGGYRGFTAFYATNKTTTVDLLFHLKMPINKMDRDPNLFGYSELQGVSFVGFTGINQCGNVSVGITTNEYSADYTLPVRISGGKFLNSYENSKVWFNDPNPDWRNEDDCGFYDCIGPLNVLIDDKDGSLSGFAYGAYFLPNNPGIARKSSCKFYSEMNSYVCEKIHTEVDIYETLIFKSLDPDSETRTFSPINITSWGNTFESWKGPTFFNELQNFMDHSWSGFYTIHIKSSIYPNIIWSGQYYNISATGTLPNSMSFQLINTYNNNRPIIVAIWYQDPQTVVVYKNGVLVDEIKYSGGSIAECQLTDPHGTNRWFYEQNTLQFVMRSEDVLVIKKIASLKINMEMDMTLSDFYSTGGSIAFIDKLAAILKIPSYRIRVVNIREGSVIVDAMVTEDATTLSDSTTTSSSIVDELNSVKDTLDAAYESGELADTLGVDILDYATDVSTVDEVKDKTDDNGGGSESQGGESGDDDNDSEGSAGNGDSPNGDNNGKGKRFPSEFEPAVNDWVIAIFAAIILVMVSIAALFGIKKPKHLVKITPEHSGIGWGLNIKPQETGKNPRTMFAEQFEQKEPHQNSPEVSIRD